MKLENYTVVDTIGSVQAMLGFAAILFCPGYVVGMMTDLFGFRERSWLERVAWAIALSFGTVAVLTSLAARLVGLGGVQGALWAAVVATLGLMLAGRRRIRIEASRPVILLGLFLLFGAAMVVAQLVDIQRGNGLLLSVTVFDQSYRVGFTDAVARTGIPPLNPFYHPGQASPLRYYYFWYAICAVCMKMMHVTARQALIASSVWSGVGLAAVIALFARHFMGVRAGLHRYILTATLLLSVTGLDLLPTLWNLFVDHQLAGDLEWWSSDQISSWMDSILWVPNHVASVVCCLTAFLLLWRTREGLSKRQSIIAALLAGVAGASAFGLSIYVAAGFAMDMAAWMLLLILRDRNYRLVGRIIVAGTGSILLLIPYLREMLGARSGTQQGSSIGPAHLLQLSVRRMIDPELITNMPWFAGLKQAHPRLLDQVVRLVVLIPGYALELGFYGAVLVLAWKRRKTLGEARSAALFLAVSGLVIVSFVRSAVIGNNDFGYRAAMLPCFFMLLLGAEMLQHNGWQSEGKPRSLTPGILRRLVLLGFAGTAFQALELRFFVPLRTAAHVADFEHLPEAALEMRRTYDAVSKVLPSSAVIQANPTNPADFFFFVSMLDSGFPMVTDAAKDCGAVFGGDPSGCPETQGEMRVLFALPAPTATAAIRACRATGADYLAVLPKDPAWNDHEGWVWTLPLVGPPLADAESGKDFRIVDCSGR